MITPNKHPTHKKLRRQGKLIFILSLSLFIVILISMFIFICSDLLCAEKKETVAVIDFEGQNVSAMDAADVSGFLRTALVNQYVYKVLDRKNMESVLQE